MTSRTEVVSEVSCKYVLGKNGRTVENACLMGRVTKSTTVKRSIYQQNSAHSKA
jgi:hypothetical protein